MWIETYLILCAILAYPLQCSDVKDKIGEVYDHTYQGINLKDYCPKMKYCPEGSHTLCLYFNPGHIAGPHCTEFKNVSMYSDLAEEILDFINEMRGKVASGTETLKDGLPMPRGYGMFKLKWDETLATFAQVLANSCMIRIDLCRATLKFSNPSQIATLVRFSMNDWIPAQHPEVKFKEKGFNKERIEYAVKEAYKNWYFQKKHVTLAMLGGDRKYYFQTSTAPKHYLSAIGGDVTHIGCGVASFVNLYLQGFDIFNIVYIVCNLSAEPKEGKPLFRTDRPTVEELCKGDKICKKHYNSKCGCPPGTDEDDRCLCTEPISYPVEPSCGKDKNCKPAVVLLPIFTVEDAPEHMISRKGLAYNETRITDLRFDHSNEEEENNERHTSFVQKIREQHSNRILPQRRSPLAMATKKRKASLFSKAPKFELHNTIKTDVAPRKDFSKAKQALDKYLNEKRKNLQHNVFNADKHADHGDFLDEYQKDPSTDKIELRKGLQFNSTALRLKHRDTPIEHHTNMSFENSQNPYRHLKIKSLYLDNEIDHEGKHELNKSNIIKEPDETLLSLLDNLEQKVKHVDLDGTEKDIFDAKLKRIYGSVVKKPGFPVLNNRHDYDDDTSGYLENNYSELEQDSKMEIKEETNAYLHDNKLKKYKTNKQNEFKGDFRPNFQLKRKKSHKFRSELEESSLFDNTKDSNQMEFDEKSYSTDLHSSDRDRASHSLYRSSLYTRPVPRDQNSLRPTMEKTDYAFRSTMNVVQDRKSKTPVKKNRGYEQLRNSDYSRIRGSNHRVKDEVKVLPYHLQYNNDKRDEYRNFNNYNIRDRLKSLRPDEDVGTDLNRSDDKRTPYNVEIMFDHGDNKRLHYNGINGERYETNYGGDTRFTEDLISADRRKFYQEKLDNLEKKKHLGSAGITEAVVRRRHSNGKHILGIRRNLSNITQNYYVPNRALYHSL